MTTLTLLAERTIEIVDGPARAHIAIPDRMSDADINYWAWRVLHLASPTALAVTVDTLPDEVRPFSEVGLRRMK